MVYIFVMKFGKSGVIVNGGMIGGFDLMIIFIKDFWDKKGCNWRLCMLEVLKVYGDLIIVLFFELIVY